MGFLFGIDLLLSPFGQGVEACYTAVMKDVRCVKDYFTYVPIGDKNCGCKGSTSALTVRKGNENADYYQITGIADATVQHFNRRCFKFEKKNNFRVWA